jgi:hypothetical protein
MICTNRNGTPMQLYMIAILNKNVFPHWMDSVISFVVRIRFAAILTNSSHHLTNYKMQFKSIRKRTVFNYINGHLGSENLLDQIDSLACKSVSHILESQIKLSFFSMIRAFSAFHPCLVKYFRTRSIFTFHLWTFALTVFCIALFLCFRYFIKI